MSSAPQPVVLLSSDVLSGSRPAFEALGLRVIGPGELAQADRAAVKAIFHLSPPDLDNRLVESLPALQIVACLMTGYDSVDLDALRARGVAVTHAQGVNAGEVAEVAMGLILSAWRDLSQGERMLREGRWTGGQRPGLRPSLAGRRLGIVGLGAIGQAIARRAEPFGLALAWWGPREQPGAPWPRAASLLQLAADSDILAVCARAEAANQAMICAEVIEALGPQGLLVNVGRGSLVDEDALIAALKDGRLGRAGLDVYAQEPTPAERWADVPNVVLTPHIGGASADAVPRLVGQAVENIRRALAGEPLLSPVKGQGAAAASPADYKPR